MKRLFWMCVLSAASLSGEAFVQKKGKSFLAVEYWTYRTSHFWDRSGVIKPAGQVFDKKEINTYFEHGMTDKDTIVVKALYDWIDESKKGKTIGFEDFEVAWKRALWRDDTQIVSSQLWLIIPSGPDNKPALRYGVFGTELDLLYGLTFKFKENYGFLDLGAGYRWYFGYPSDQIRAHINLGFDLTKKWQLILSTYLEYGVFNGTPQVNESIIFNDPNYRLLKGYITLRYRLSKNTSLTLGAYNHLWGQNTGTGGGYRGGVWIDF